MDAWKRYEYPWMGLKFMKNETKPSSHKGLVGRASILLSIFSRQCSIAQGFQVFHQVRLLGIGQPQPEMCIVMVDHIQKRGEPSVMIEAAFRVSPQTLERRCAVHQVR